MPRLFLHLLLLSSWLLLGGCIDRYVPEVPAAAQANLVVDGFINPRGSTVIRLSRTFSVNTKNTAPAEARAQVVIQDDAGQRYSLTESVAGTYTSAALTLNPALQYQLRFTTAQGRAYASDLEPVVLTPTIDSLTWRLTPEQGAQVYLSTRGAATASRFYRWEYEETYQFTAAFESTIVYDPRRNFVRPRTGSIYRCWRTERSTTILQSNTTQLSQNALVSFPLLTLLPSQKIKLGYSLLLQQVGQTQAEYDYWERLRKSTENLGTVNDPLPGRVTGNVHALADAAEPVLGYVGVHSVAEKRLFIDGARFPTPRPGSVFYDPSYASCVQPDYLGIFQALPQFRQGLTVPILPSVSLMTGDTIGATFSSPNCVDCRLRGSNIKPSFWP